MPDIPADLRYSQGHRWVRPGAGTSLVPPFSERGLWAQVIRHARCADSRLSPDEWFPVSSEPAKARQEAASAIAICGGCLVRRECLTLSLRQWDIAQHGIWGGLIAADRARLRRRLLADHGQRSETAIVRAEGATAISRVLLGLVEAVAPGER